MKHYLIKQNSILDYHIGVLGIGFNKTHEMYFSIGRDVGQDGNDFSDENVLKDRVFFIKSLLSLR